MRRIVIATLQCALCILHGTAGIALAQGSTPIVTELVIEQEGRPVVDEQIRSLIETTVGSPLAIRDVRESIAHLVTLDRFDDVRVLSEEVSGGVRLRYVLVPSHPVDRIEFTGTVRLPEDDLRRAIQDRFGLEVPPASRAGDVAAALKDTYRARGYPAALVAPRIVEFHAPDRSTLVLDIQAGQRVSISQVTVEQSDRTPLNVLVGAPDVRVGQPYDSERIDRELLRYATTMRERGYLEAQAAHTVEFTPQGADVRLQVRRGPHVTIAFTGDPIPPGERDRLVPIRTEASVSQDLLEDSQNAIVTYFRQRGYRDAQVEYRPVERDDELTLTFNVQQGPRYVVERVVVSGNTAITTKELLDAINLDRGDPFVQSTADGRAGAIVTLYRNRGYTKAQLRLTITTLPNTESEDVERGVEVAVTITEGPRTLIRSVALRGGAAVPETDLRGLLVTAPGRPYAEVDIVADRDRLELEYRNRGFQTVLVTPMADLAENDSLADVTFNINEGQRISVDHVIIVGNRRTSTDIIERELVLKPGEPLGSAAVIESQQRLTALGLFRRVRITEVTRGGNAARDVVVRVEEAPPNTHAYGAGLEVGSRLRNANGSAEERYEFVPRGSFEIGRRNMGGKNRSINFFTRVALRSRDLVVSDDGVSLEEQPEGDGFNEYRIFSTYREPRIFDTRADLQITGLVDQAVRSSFNFNRREARAELGLRASQQISVAGRYSIERTRVFINEGFSEDEQPLIDRLFPQVRLSKLSGTLIRDARQDLLDPAGGTLLTVTGDLALRAIGSQVGYAKTYVEAFAYPQLPFGRRTVLAVGGRLGVAHGFEQQKDDDTVSDLPASERFFAGGDTTVRGFSLDRLGTTETITSSGFPTGGSGLAILNAELRFMLPWWSMQAVTFVDAGNVYAKANQVNLTDLRPSYGVGARIRLPLLTAPIRVDLGINPDRREIVAGTRERGYVLHVSLGQAF